MNTINQLKYNNIDSCLDENFANIELNSIIDSHWLDVRNINNHHHFSDEFINICHQHHHDERWILMINPEEKVLERLSKEHKIDAARILRVHANKVNVNVRNIEAALAKGNCSAVVLCNANFAETELSHFMTCAQRGNTHCIVLKNANRMH